MVNIDIDFNNKIGKIKPMHAVNNGPVYKFASDQRITNLDSYRQAGIPYARTHDASFYEDYGGEQILRMTPVIRIPMILYLRMTI